MRWLKFTANQKPSWGIVEGDRVIAVDGDPFGEWQRTQRSHVLADVKIELPVTPRTFSSRPSRMSSVLVLSSATLPASVPAFSW